jgi:hypothetical protein
VVDLVHEIPVQAASPNFEPVRIDVESTPGACPPGGIDSTAVLSKHRLALGGIGARAAARKTLRREGEAVAAAPIHTKDTRIRLLSRF